MYRKTAQCSMLEGNKEVHLLKHTIEKLISIFTRANGKTLHRLYIFVRLVARRNLVIRIYMNCVSRSRLGLFPVSQRAYMLRCVSLLY